MGDPRHLLRTAIAVAGLLLATGCGTDPAEIGEDCHDPGSTEACVEGGICVKATFDTECREICERDEDCEGPYVCNEVRDDGVKACRGCVPLPHMQGC